MKYGKTVAFSFKEVRIIILSTGLNKYVVCVSYAEWQSFNNTHTHTHTHTQIIIMLKKKSVSVTFVSAKHPSFI